MAHHHAINWVCHPYVWLVVCFGSPPWVLNQSGPNHTRKIQLPSYYKMSSVCICESGLEPHWQGASFYKTIFISFSEWGMFSGGGCPKVASFIFPFRLYSIFSILFLSGFFLVIYLIRRELPGGMNVFLVWTSLNKSIINYKIIFWVNVPAYLNFLF